MEENHLDNKVTAVGQVVDERSWLRVLHFAWDILGTWCDGSSSEFEVGRQNKVVMCWQSYPKRQGAADSLGTIFNVSFSILNRISIISSKSSFWAYISEPLVHDWKSRYSTTGLFHLLPRSIPIHGEHLAS